MIYKGKKDSLKQVYILLITCGFCRAAHLELVRSQKIEESIRAFKRFVARQRRPERIYSDNWQFNLSRASWWWGRGESVWTNGWFDEAVFIQNCWKGWIFDRCYLEDMQFPVLTLNTLAFEEREHSTRRKTGICGKEWSCQVVQG